MTPGTKVFDKISKREGTVSGLIGTDVCIIETADREKFTQKIKLLTKIQSLSGNTKAKS